MVRTAKELRTLQRDAERLGRTLLRLQDGAGLSPKEMAILTALNGAMCCSLQFPKASFAYRVKQKVSLVAEWAKLVWWALKFGVGGILETASVVVASEKDKWLLERLRSKTAEYEMCYYFNKATK